MSLNTSTKEQQKIEESIQPSKIEINNIASSSKISNVSISMKIQDKPITSITKKSRLVKPQIQQTKKEEIQTSDDMEISDITESTLSRMNSCDIDETDDYVDEDIEADPTEMTVGEMLGHHGSENENDFGYGYDEEDY